ncbi:MAG TPA: hypothetical protein PLY86_21485, partial [bacterium]|nr:hypothetical protein [bacterium]
IRSVRIEVAFCLLGPFSDRSGLILSAEKKSHADHFRTVLTLTCDRSSRLAHLWPGFRKRLGVSLRRGYPTVLVLRPLLRT